MGRKKTVATRSVGNKTLDKEVCFKHVLRQGEIQLMVLTRGGLSLAERGKLGIALCHGAEGMRKQTKELNERQSILYPLKKKRNETTNPMPKRLLESLKSTISVENCTPKITHFHSIMLIFYQF